MNSGKDNHYADYLPKNRYAKEGGFSPLLSTFIIILFVGFFGVMIFNYYNKSDSLHTEYRYYNLNLLENIRLDSINSDKDVVWESNSDCVVIEDRVVTAVSPGKAYIIGTKTVGNRVQQVSDLTITVLGNDKEMYLENHSIEMNIDEKQTIKVNQNDDTNYDKGVVQDNSLIDQSVSKEEIEKIIHSSVDMQGDLGSDEVHDIDDDDNDSGTHEIITTDDNDGVSTTDNPLFNEDNVLKYESSEPSVAVVDDKGNIEPKSEGTTVITVTDSKGNQDHTYVTIREDDITISSLEYNLKVGDSKQIEYKVNQNKYKNEDVTWKSDRNDIVTVTNGVIKAIKAGTANIVASVGETSKEIKVVVSENIILPTDITLSHTSLDLTVGDSIAVSGSVVPTNSTSKGLTWKSSNSSVVSVDQFGNVTAINAGNAVISVVTSNGISKNISVKVKNKVINVSDIRFNSSNISLKVGESTKISYTIVPDGATDKTVTFTYDKNYISLDSSGNLKALQAGTTNVTVTTANGHSATLRVDIVAPVMKASEIKINEGNLKLVEGSSKKLSVTVNPSGVNTSGLTWKSSNNNVVSVSGGTIVAKGIGIATVTATLDGKSSSIQVEVSKKVISVSSLVLNKTSISLNVGKTYSDLKVNVNPSNASNKNVIWSSSNTKVATVDKNGKITAVGKGKATITAKSSDNNAISASCAVNVTYKVSMSLDCGSKSLVKGGSLTVKAKVSPSGANQGVTWTSSNTKVATIDKNGKIIGKASGNTTITAKSIEDSSKVLSCNVSVKEDKGYTVIINPSHQPSNSTSSSNKSKYGTEMKSMFVLGRIFEQKLKEAGYKVVITPDSGSIDSNDRCWQIDNWSKCGRKYVKWAVKKGNANKDSKNVYIALHSNAIGGRNTRITGPVVFYPYRYNSSKSVALAKSLCNSLVSTYHKHSFPTTWSASGCVSVSRNVGEPSMYYDAGGKGAAVLIEVGFHDHTKNQKFIEQHGNDLAAAMVSAVNNYVSTH